MVTIDITLVFHVEDEEQKLRDFAFKLGPEGLDQMLQQIQQDSVRALVRQRTYDQVYDLMNVVHDDALSGTRKDLNTSLAEYGVVVSDLNITNVHLPEDMHKSMQTSTIYHNENEYAKLKQEHEVLLIDNDEKEKKEIQLMKEKLEQFEAERKNALAKEQAEYQIIRAETKKILAEIKEQENADVKRIHADSRLEVAGITRKRDVSLATIKAGGQAEADQLLVEARAFEIGKKAEADRIVAEKKAEALTIEADAEAEAAALLTSVRLFKEKMRQLQVIEGLSTNRDISISGKNADNYVAQMVSSGRQAAILGVNNI
jgi:regulator of protease activity HflC (stomatin/prohibitin superfamily)